MILYMKRVEVDLGIASWLITAASFVMACAEVALHTPPQGAPTAPRS